MEPISNWGKDHWSLLAYVETLCVDGNKGVGTIDRRRMRCNEDVHLLLNYNLIMGGGEWKPEYSTRTKKGTIDGHDDWDCLKDLEEAGYIEILTLVNGFVVMTDKGQKVAAAIREHKSSGGNWGEFTLPSEV